MSQGNTVERGLPCDSYLDKSLQDDKNIQATLKNFYSSIEVLEADLQKALAIQAGRTLNTNDQIKLDSYLAYLTSTLFWIHLKLQGVDVAKVI